jgi:hypothetical protein
MPTRRPPSPSLLHSPASSLSRCFSARSSSVSGTKPASWPEALSLCGLLCCGRRHGVLCQAMRAQHLHHLVCRYACRVTCSECGVMHCQSSSSGPRAAPWAGHAIEPPCAIVTSAAVARSGKGCPGRSHNAGTRAITLSEQVNPPPRHCCQATPWGCSCSPVQMVSCAGNASARHEHHCQPAIAAMP